MARLIGAALLFTVAAFMALGLSLANPKPAPGIQVFTWLVAVGIPGGAAFLLARSALQARRAAALPRLPPDQVEVIRLAGRKSGRLTVFEVVGELGLSPEDAERTLGSLMEQGLGDVEMTEGGLVVYRFADVQRIRDKAGSRPILDR